MSPAALFLIGAVRLYRLTVPNRLKPRCIFTPTCSQFAIEALRLYGFFGGIRASIGRLGRCNGALYAPGEDHP
jgi:putative membrane protein insertion efficiency factor